MELACLIEALSDPAAYPSRTETVEVRHTHISVVFLVGQYAYKIKKPVDLGFLDFSSLAKRHHFCEEEIRLNSRLAPAVYRGVVPVTRHGEAVRVEGTGEVIEWAVKMERLPDDATLQHQLDFGEVGGEVVSRLARKIATFHSQAERGPRIAACGRFDVVAGNARENFTQSASQVGIAVSPTVFDRLQTLTEEVLIRQRGLIESRAHRDIPRDTHGDLRLGHVYLLPGRTAPDDIVVIDCIEFNERFRFADPVADMAFLAMGFKFHRRSDLAQQFSDTYFQTSGDEEGRMLLPLYTSYRAVVRAKVEGFKMMELEVPETERREALAKSRGYWLLALGELEHCGRRPGLVLVGGLPGTGKSTLAAELADRAGFTIVRSDVVRKELAQTSGKVGDQGAAFEQGIYSPEWTQRTYAECLRRAEALIFEGQRVVVDASFREDAQRRAFLESAVRWGVPTTFLVCEADRSTVRQRIANRSGDASDADWTIYLRAAEAWQQPGVFTRRGLRTIIAESAARSPFDQALSALREIGIYE